MIIRDLNLVKTVFMPNKTDAPLPVDPDAEKALQPALICQDSSLIPVVDYCRRGRDSPPQVCG